MQEEHVAVLYRCPEDGTQNRGLTRQGTLGMRMASQVSKLNAQWMPHSINFRADVGVF